MRGLWAWAAVGVSLAAIIGGAAVESTVGKETSTVAIGGATVTNALAVDDEAVRTYDSSGANRSSIAGRVGCYFVTGSPLLACGPTGDGYGASVFDVFRLTLTRRGSGTAITAVTPDGAHPQRALPAGTGLVDPHGWAGTVDRLGRADVASVHAGTLSAANGAVTAGLAGMVVTGVVAAATSRHRKRRRAERDARDGRARDDAALVAGFETAGRWAWAAPVVPPTPTLIEPAPAPPVAVPPPPAAVSVPSLPGLGVPAADDGGDGDDDPPAHHWSGPAVLILGPVTTVGWAREPDRRVLVELAAYLVTHHERRVTVADLREAVWPEHPGRPSPDVKAETIGQHMSRLRRCLGAEHLPDAGGRTGWQLASTVTSDWFRLQALAEAARHAEAGRALELRREALALVRGRPFSGVADGAYAWVWDQMLVSEIEAVVAGLAHATAEGYLASGRPRLADWAARRGLLAVPTDEQLLADRMAAAAGEGGGARLERAWRDARAVLGDQATDGPLAAVYDQLRAGPP